MKNFIRMALCAAALMFAVEAGAWGGQGHITSVKIAQRYLTERTKANLAKYFDYELSKDAVWMDHHRRDEGLAHTSKWHGAFVRTDRDFAYDPEPQKELGDAIVALDMVDKNLSNWKEQDDSTVIISVRMIIHMVADIHCPVHVHFDGRKAKWEVEWNGPTVKPITKFHAFYDLAPKNCHPTLNSNQYADFLDTFSEEQIRQIQAGTPRDWLQDSGRSCRMIFDINPFGTRKLDPKSVEKSTDLVDSQVRKAGYRIAALLNKYFDR